MTTQVATVGVKDSPAGSEQWVHRFAEGSREMRRPLPAAKPQQSPMIPPACCPFPLMAR